jgi:hypothetical protein
MKTSCWGNYSIILTSLLLNYFSSLKKVLKTGYPASIWGHSSHVQRLFMFYPTEIAELQARQINTVFQIFDTHLSRDIDKTLSITLINALQAFPLLRHKILTFA